MALNFDPSNKIIQLCMKAMITEESGGDNALEIFMEAWLQSETEFEKFIAAFHVSKRQSEIAQRLHWLEISLLHALTLKDWGTMSALPTLYRERSQCFELMGESEKAQQSLELSMHYDSGVKDPGPFYHGTKANLKDGEFLTPGYKSNYRDDLIMNHIYFTAQLSAAVLAANLAQGDGSARIYRVEPTGTFENDPNVTDKRFPGNLTQSYRSEMPLKIVGEVINWQDQSEAEKKDWREKVAANQGEII